MKTFLVKRHKKTVIFEVKFIWHNGGFKKWFMRNKSASMRAHWFLQATNQICYE